MPQRTLRWQDRWFPWLSLFVAALWVVTARQQAPQIRECNSTRIVSSLLVGGMGSSMPADATSPTSAATAQNASLPPASSGLMSSFSLLTSGKRPGHNVTAIKAQSQLANLHKAGAAVETVVYVWEWMMYAVSALLVIAAVFSWLTGRTRVAHLAVATVMMLAMIATLAGMRIIEHPSAGAMPPLPLDRHLLASVALSSYAWVLLIAFARRATLTDADQ